MRIGLLTGGGDSPATNAAIRAVLRQASDFGFTAVGVRNGWAGMIDNDLAELGLADVSGILPKGGTILGTSRTNPFKIEGGVDKIVANFKGNGLNAIIAIGGDDTMGVLHKLHGATEMVGVGVPQTIDNDIAGTDYAIGFDSAVAIATDACDKLHTTAESHHRVMVLEVMGRDAGHIALEAGLAGGADIILVPEVRFDIDDVCDRVKDRIARGKTFSIVVVAEGAKPVGEEQIVRTQKVDAFGHMVLGGVGDFLGTEIERCSGIETRVTILGHLQRGGIPTAYDRMLATRFGVMAVRLVKEERWDHMVALRGSEVTSVPLEDGLKLKPIDRDLYEIAQLFR